MESDNFTTLKPAWNVRNLDEFIESSTPKPDVTILDISMTVIEDYTTLLESKSRWPDLKLIIFSADDHEALVKKMYSKRAVVTFIPSTATTRQPTIPAWYSSLQKGCVLKEYTAVPLM